jgi:hypothetical protein
MAKINLYTYIHIPLTLYPSSETPTFYKNFLAIKDSADVTNWLKFSVIEELEHEIDV